MMRVWAEGGRCFFRYLNAQILARLRARLPYADVTLYAQFCNKPARFEIVDTPNQSRMGVPICDQCAPKLADMIEFQTDRSVEA